MSNAMIATHLNEMHQLLNSINDDYPRRCGNMVMVSHEMEDKVEEILHSMKLDADYLKTLTDEQIAAFTDDVEGYRSFLATTDEVIKNNTDEVARAREFLARYYSH